MDQRLDIRDGSDGQQIHAENDAPAGHVLGGDLAPPARGGTQVDAHLRRTEKVILLVDLGDKADVEEPVVRRWVDKRGPGELQDALMA